MNGEHRRSKIECRSGSAFTMVEVIIVIGVLVVLGAIAYPVSQAMIRKSDQAKCLNNLRQIGVALALYLPDHNDRFPNVNLAAANPEDEVTLEAALRDYVGSKEVWRCPADKEEHAQTGSSYLWNSTQSGRHKMRTSFFGAQGRPDLVPLVTDKEAYHGERNGVNMLYADYHLSNKVEFNVGSR